MELRPHGSRLLIRKYSDEETAGGIIIPDYVKKVSLRCRVLEVGPDCQSAEVGDDIFIGTYAPIEVATKYYQDSRDSYHKNDNEDLFVMNEDDILLFVEPDAKKGKKDGK